VQLKNVIQSITKRLEPKNSISAAALTVFGPVLATVTAIAVSKINAHEASTLWKFLLLSFDIAYLILLLIFIIHHIQDLVLHKKNNMAGSRLNTRLITAFVSVACGPVIVLAIFSTFILNFGMEAWFSEKINLILRNSLVSAQYYLDEHYENLRFDSYTIAHNIKSDLSFLSPFSPDFTAKLQTYKSLYRLADIYIISPRQEILAHSQSPAPDNIPLIKQKDIDSVRNGNILIFFEKQHGRIYASIGIDRFFDKMLVVSRSVNKDALALLDRSKETFALYEQTRQSQNKIFSDFVLFYISFAALNLMAAAWFGVWFASRMGQPIAHLVSAAETVGQGDFSIRVHEYGKDEIGMLSIAFNKMTQEIEKQHENLVFEHLKSEKNRLLNEAVLAGVSAGVIGLDSQGRIEFLNRSACQLLDCTPETLMKKELSEHFPDVAKIVSKAQSEKSQFIESQISMTVHESKREFLVRVTSEYLADNVDGFIVTFDDITELITAQRMAAWGDVAKRIAHEIKNPLTPIQLCANRLYSKYSESITQDRDMFERYTLTIVQQVDNIKRIVDEFSRFTRLPSALLVYDNLVDIIRNSTLLQQAASTDICFEILLPNKPVYACFDKVMLSQAIVNVLKNAIEAIYSQIANKGDKDFHGLIRIRLYTEKDKIIIAFEDNGIGLPDNHEALFAPYVTTRQQGRGLGLDIVKKTMEQHNGSIILGRSTLHNIEDHSGARVQLVLPIPTDDIEVKHL
jgi:two-component system nitrogen regulation sensor histidine kinase NtrY